MNELTVWVVQYGNDEPWHISAIYDNEAAARAHVEHHDGMLVGGHTDQMLRLSPWSVQSDYRIGEPSS